jgi:pimeloyl-ACP methyl ester carboxylesterase
MAFDYLVHGILGRSYRLHVNHTGNRNGQVVVLLHGIAASSADWHNVLPFLENEYHCITVDLLGFGNSPKPRWSAYSMDDHMRAIYRTLNKLHLGQNYILIGHSLGSFLAARYAIEHEANIQRLLLLSPPVYPPLDSISSRGVRKLTGVLLNIYKLLRTNPRITPETFKSLPYIAPIPRSLINDPGVWVSFMRTLKECIEQQTILQDVAKLSLPIDVFYGTLDQVVIGANVKLLKQEKDNLTLHEFLGTHDLTKRYGKLIASKLI